MIARLLVVLTLPLPYLAAQALHISGENIRAHVKYLASDELEGRGVGSRGEKLTTKYLEAQLKTAGVLPGGDNGSYFQKVPFIGATTLPDSTLKIGATSLAYVKDYVGTAASQQPDNDFDAEAIFVGHGVTAPEFGWDDYKGMDVKGKVLVFFTNEPPSSDTAFFNGPALTYYGRWSYKYEEATRRGAIAALIIHTAPTAGYGWGVVSSSFSQESPSLVLPTGQRGLALAGWLTQDAGAKLVARTGKSLDQLLDLANQKSFRPIPLSIRVQGHIHTALRDIESMNVIGRVEGADPILDKQAILFSAHWDHEGVGVPVNGDKIYNGAVDNATGCAVVLELARIWAGLPNKSKRSALFLFVTAEESGLLGSQYYGQHPAVPAGQTAADINFDGLYPFGKTNDVVVTGAERTTLWPLVQHDAARMSLRVSAEAEPGQGHYYRSDHFSLARVGIPAFSIQAGNDYIGKPADFSKTVFEEYNAKHYHQPSDEYKDDWDFAGMEQLANYGLILGMDFANTPKLPTWKAGDEFLAARMKSAQVAPAARTSPQND